MKSKCCNTKAYKQEAGNYFCSHCISICEIKMYNPIYAIFTFLILLININCYAPNSLNKKVYPENKVSLDDYYKANPLIIKVIESNGNTKSVSFKDAKGIMQITNICLNDYNNINKTHYNENDLFIKDINIKIADWYLSERIPSLLKEHNIKVNVMNILICYNAGILECIKFQNTKHLNLETQNYINKYFQSI